MSNKVLEWIKKTGFALELEAASAFRAAGFEVRQSFTYPDPQSDKGREIDVLAQVPDIMGIIEIYFVLECKASSKPWVVLASESTLENYSRLSAFAITSEAAREAIAKKIISNDSGKPNYLQRSSRCGYGFRQAFGSNDDAAYAATIGALKACSGLVKDRITPTIPRLAFAFPVIVVDSPLFECSLKGDGELHLQEVEESDFLCSAYIPDVVGCCIKVIRKELLSKYATEAKQLEITIRQSLKDEEDSAIKLTGLNKANSADTKNRAAD